MCHKMLESEQKKLAILWCKSQLRDAVFALPAFRMQLYTHTYKQIGISTHTYIHTYMSMHIWLHVRVCSCVHAPFDYLQSGIKKTKPKKTTNKGKSKKAAECKKIRECKNAKNMRFNWGHVVLWFIVSFLRHFHCFIT